MTITNQQAEIIGKEIGKALADALTTSLEYIIRNASGLRSLQTGTENLAREIGRGIGQGLTGETKQGTTN